MAQGAAIVEAENGAVARAANEARGYGSGGQFPIESERGPHDAGETELALRFAKAEPADAVRRAEPQRADAGTIFQGALATGDLVEDERGRAAPEAGVIFGVIADLVAGGDERGRARAGGGRCSRIEKKWRGRDVRRGDRAVREWTRWGRRQR